LRLFSGIGRPLAAKKRLMRSAEAESSTSGTPSTLATVSLVRSSAVGPMPPVEITTSACASAWRHAHASRSGQSPTVSTQTTSTPISKSLSAIQLAFESTMRPVVSSSPVERMAARSIMRPPGRRAPRRRCARAHA